MLPTSGSTSRSWTSLPNLDRTYLPIESGGEVGARAQDLGRGAELAASRQQRRSSEREEAGRQPQQQTFGDVVQTVPPHRRLAGLRARSASRRAPCGRGRRPTAHGPGTRRRPRRSPDARRTGLDRITPPSLLSASKTVTSRAGFDRGVRGSETGDATADHGDAPVAAHDVPSARMTRSANAAITAGVVVDARGASERETVRGRSPARLDVEVVEHLEMIGDEPDRADEHSVGVSVCASSSMTCRMSGPNHGSGVRPALCQASPQLSRPDRGGHTLGGCPDLRRVRVVGRQDPLGEGVRGEQHARARRASSPSLLCRSLRDEIDEGRLGRPARDLVHLDVVRRGGSCEPTEVLADGDTPSSAARAPDRQRVRKPCVASSSTDSSMNGAACFIPNTTWYCPAATRSSAACMARCCASVRSVSGEIPPIAS